MNLLRLLQQRFAPVLADYADDPAPFVAMVRPAQDTRFGDFQANCAMPLAKRHGLNPKELAAKIAEKVHVQDLCREIEIAGPGFINLTLRDDLITTEVNKLLQDDRLGVEAANPPRKIVIDFSSPNVAKPMHVGHLRSSVIGDSLCRTLRFLGHEVTSDNHIGDWGTQFGMIIYGYKNFLDKDAYGRHPVAELARLYRLVNRLSDFIDARSGLPEKRRELETKERELAAAPVPPKNSKDPADKDAEKALKRLRSEIDGLKDEIGSLSKKIERVESNAEELALANAHPAIAKAAREETAKLHAGDATNLALWNEFMPACLAALQGVYDRLGIKFDLTLGESWFNPMLPGVVDELLTNGMAVESDGAICVFIPGFKAPFIIRKADGAYTYATTDLATIRYRVSELKADTILYVVDTRQGDHFELLFETVKKWGIAKVDLRHVNFGTVMGKDRRPYKTRDGDTVGLESLLDEAVIEARAIIDANEAQKSDKGEEALDDAARQEVSEIIGIGGIKYADLHHARESDYVFDWEKMLAKEGDTATYIQYAYARTKGILRRNQIDPQTLLDQGARIVLSHAAERSLALQLLKFPEALDSVCTDYRPNQLTQYVFETANSFSTFYDNCPIKGEADEALRHSRCLLAELTSRVLKQALSLLGIQTVERM
ncbi:MAG: arginine--tRNA ligase [Planctomycetota bacterium]|nr:MAG: arginine--tRNA ligase [Planctomycetota bacterium]